MNFSAFQSNLDSLKIDNEEPECEIIPETSKMLNVIISGTVDHARLHCDVTNIAFKKTFMFQVRLIFEKRLTWRPRCRVTN